MPCVHSSAADRLVRVVPKVGPGSTMYVDETSGMVMAKDGLVHIPGLGMVGVHIRYKDFRDVGGMKLPFLTISKFASNQIGTVKTTLDDASVGGDVPAETFLPPKRFR